MYRIIAMFVILSMCVGLSAQTINITGKVTNKSSKGIAGAVVTLVSKKLSDTTGASGAYAIKSTNVVLKSIELPGAGKVAMSNGIVTVNLQKAAPVLVELFDFRGNLCGRILDNPVSAGIYKFNLAQLPFASKMMIVRVRTGQETISFQYFPFNSGKNQVYPKVDKSIGYQLAKAQAVVDTIQVSAPRYTSTKLAVSFYETVIDITLDTANCKSTPSKASTSTVTGTGPHKVVIETNTDPGIKNGTIYRPTDLAPGKNYPIFVWGEGACSQDGLSNRASMGEIASWGYFVVADGSPSGGGGTAAALISYVTWAIAENGNPCSAYYQSLDTTKIAADGFSCGGLMAENAAGDPRFTAVGFTSSGLFNADSTVYKKIHTPFKILLGGTADMAYANGVRDYNQISALGIPIIFLSKDGAGHGGDLGNGRGDFNLVNLAWLNWQLKGDTGATGKAFLMGPTCRYCTASGWEFKSKNLQ